MLDNYHYAKLFVILLIFIQIVVLVNSGSYLYAQPAANPSPPSFLSEMTYSEGSRNISGHYNNSTYGITDILIPNGWIGQETVQAPVLFELGMYPSDRTEELSTPSIQLTVANTSKFIEMSGGLGLMNSTKPVNSLKDLLKSRICILPIRI